MDFETLIEPAAILPGLRANSKKQVLQELAEKAAEITGLTEREIFETILQREKLGSTGVGNGIAIPHCRLEDCHQAIGALLQLDGKIDFDALDGQPVDLIFVLLVPQEATEQHLQILKMLAGKLDRADLRDALRAAPDADALYHVMVNDGDGS